MARCLAVWNPEQERDILVDTGGPRSEGGYDSELVPSPAQVGAPREGLSDSIPHDLTIMVSKQMGPEVPPLREEPATHSLSVTWLCQALLCLDVFLCASFPQPPSSPAGMPLAPHPWQAVSSAVHPNFAGPWLCIPSGLYPMGFVITD